MPDLSVKIGGQKYKLKESEQEFSVLTINNKAIDKVRRKNGVKNILQVAPGVQVVRSTGPKDRDMLMDEIRRTGISHHLLQ